VEERLGSASLVLGVDLDAFNAGLERAERIAKQRGESISKSLSIQGFGQSRVVTSIQSEVENAGTAFDGLAGSVGLLRNGLATLGVAAVAKQIADVGIAAESANVRLNALSGRFGETTQAQFAAAEAAKLLNLSQAEAANGFAQLYASLRPTGVSLEQIQTIFVGVTAAAKNTGLSAESVNNALIQLTQGLSSGRLQGDELRSVLEQLPPLSQAIAKELNVPVGALKQLGSEGKISTDIIIKALERLKSDELGSLSKSLNTSQEKLKALSIESQNFQKELSTAFGPAALAVVGGLTRAFKELAGAIRQANLANQYPQLAARADKQAGDLVQAKIGPFGGSGFFGGVSVQYNGKTYSGTATGVKNEITKAILADLIKDLSQGAGGGGAPPQLPKPSPTPSATVVKASQETKERLDLLQQTINLSGTDLKLAESQFKIQKSITEEKRLQGEYAKARAAADAAGGTSQDKNTAAKEAALRLAAASDTVKINLAEGSKLLSDAAADTTSFVAQFRLQAQALDDRIAKAKQLAGIEDQAQRAQVAAAQSVLESINQARQKQAELFLQLQNQAAKGDSTENIRSTIAQLSAAGGELELALVNGGRALKDQLNEATRRLNDTLSSNFAILTQIGKQRVLEQAQANITRGVQTGLVDPTLIPSQTNAQAFIAFGQQAAAIADAVGSFNVTQRSVADAQAQLAQDFASTGALVTKSIGNLADSAIPNLVAALNENANASRTITVTVNADTGQTFINQAAALP
jgi:tape measure domain-containing protein